MQGNEPEVVLAIFPLLAGAAIGALGAGIGAYGKYKAARANKPIKERAFKQRAQTGYLKRYMADLRGRSADRSRTELAMRPALRAIGAQQQQGQRMLAYKSAQQGLEGSGIEAQKQLALQQGTTQAVAGLGEKVLNQQLTQARQMQAQKEGQRMKLAGEISRQEGAVSEANRLSTFQAAETNRKRQQQYDQSVAAAKGNIGVSMLGGALQGATPELTSMAGDWGTSADIMKNITYTDTGGGSSYGAQGGKVNKEGIAQYQTGGYVYEDVSSAVPGIATAEEELKKTYQTEQDTKLAEHERQLALDVEGKKQFDIDLATKNKQIEEANLLAEQKHAEQKALFETGEKRRDVLDYQKEATKITKDQGVEGIYGTKGLKGENVAGALEYLKTDPEEYNVLKEKADVLKEYGLGEKQYDKAKEHYTTMSEKYAGTEGIPQTFEEYLQKAIDTDQTEFWGKDLSKRGKKKLSKKYDKKTLALLQSKGGFGAVDESFDPKSLEGSGMTEDEYAQLVKDRQEAYEYDEALETKDPGEFKPQELTKEEYKPQYAGEAPKLQEITAKETEKIQREQIRNMYKADIDVMGNIQKAQKNRETADFFKTFSAGNMTTDQIWSHPYAVANPAKIATLISNQQKTQQGQFAEVNEKNILAQINAAGTDVNTLQMIQNSPGYNQLDAATQRTLNNEIQSQIGKAETKFKNVETTTRNIRGHLVDLGITSAGGKSTIGAEGVAIADDPLTEDVDERLQDPGGNIAQILEQNPNGITLGDRDQLYLYVDELLKNMGGSGLDPDAMKTAQTIGDASEDDQNNLIAKIMGMQGAIDKKSSITKLLKELLKLPVLPAEGTLEEKIAKVDQGGGTQSGGFQFKP